MDPDAILDMAVTIALFILSLSFLVTIGRILKGPTLPDRILGLDMLVAIAIGFIAVIGIKTGEWTTARQPSTRSAIGCAVERPRLDARRGMKAAASPPSIRPTPCSANRAAGPVQAAK